MTFSIQGKTAIVTGASSGIGRATARLLVKHGVNVALVARSADKLASLQQELGNAQALAVPADLTDPKTVTNMMTIVKQKFGSIDILHANAGLYIGGDVVDGDPDDFDRLLDTNVNSVIRCIREVLPFMLAQGEGDIIATSSVSGHQAIQWEPVYSASKHAIQSFIHGLRRQLGAKNIRVGEVAPGTVLNELWGVVDPTEIQRRVAIGDGLQSEDVAEAVVFMLTRPRNVTIRDLVMLPRSQDI